MKDKRGPTCPYCGTILLNFKAKGWSNEELLLLHFNTEYENVRDLGVCHRAFRAENPCHGKKLPPHWEELI